MAFSIETLLILIILISLCAVILWGVSLYKDKLLREHTQKIVGAWLERNFV